MGTWAGPQLLFLLTLLWVHSALATRLADVSALLALKTSFGNPASLSSWVNDPCTNAWVGVTCAPLGTDVTVTALSLPGLNLAGPIASEIGNLTNLQQLNLANNPITGQIPKELGSLTQLRYLYINGTQVSGQIPQGLGALGQLLELRFDNNLLTGGLPYDLTNLTSIQTMQFQNNALNGSIPYQFGGLPALVGLYMQNNNFSGQIPNSLAQSPNLDILAVFNNTLQGNIPQEFGNLKKLRGLYLHQNLLTGPIPSTLGNCVALVELFLNNNQMSGPIPPAIFALPALTSLVLSNNQFTGTLPPTPNPLLVALLIDNNTLTGSIPQTYASIQTFRYTPNDFCSYQIGFVCQGGGCLRTPGPQCIAQAPAPAPFAIAPAVAPGPAPTPLVAPLATPVPLASTVAPVVVLPTPSPIPTTPATPAPTAAPLKCAPGYVVSSLSGSPLCVSPMEASFRLADRNLPDWTTDLQTSFIADLASTIGLAPNQINITRVAQGSILVNTNFYPVTGTALDNQTVSDIRSKLGGNNTPLALNAARYGNVFVTDLVSPATGGIATLAPVPSSGGSSGLSGGAIGGIIAAAVVFSIALCIGAYLLFTRRSSKADAKETFSPAAEYDTKPHTELQVYDAPAGKPMPVESKPAPAPAPAYSPPSPAPVPQPFTPPQETFTPRAAAVSARSPSSAKWAQTATHPTETPLPPPSPSLNLPPPPGRSPSVKSPVLEPSPPPMISPPAKKSPSFFSRKKKESTPPALDLGAEGPAAAARSKLLLDIPARNFSLRELQTATNNFARGNLLGEGGLGRVYRAGMEDKEFAVKRLDQKVGEGEEHFLREVGVLARLHHAHVVDLVGYCCEGTSRILVHEFVPNRTLQDYLHGDTDTGRKPGTAITWNARMKIALGMARGLEYLHAQDPPVVHSCFKTSNIMLDHDLVPKIADSGVARFFPEGADKQLSQQMLGTFAYAAPEYAMTGEHTVKADVYSFGVVLLELMTGRRPLDSSRPRYEQSLVRWATPMLHSLERLQEMVDPELEGVYPAKSLLKFAEIVSECVQPEAEFRPTMAEVVEQLQTHLVPFGGFNARSMRRAGSQNSLASPLRSPSMPVYSRSPSYYDHRDEDE